jgi:hypothetical protein
MRLLLADALALFRFRFLKRTLQLDAWKSKVKALNRQLNNETEDQKKYNILELQHEIENHNKIMHTKWRGSKNF